MSEVHDLRARIVEDKNQPEGAAFDIALGERPLDRSFDVAFDGTNYFAWWRNAGDGSSLRGIRISASGSVLDVGPTSIVLSSSPVNAVGVVRTTTTLAVAYQADGKLMAA